MSGATDGGLFKALLERRSVRRYSKRPVEPEQLKAVAALVEAVEPLVVANEFRCQVRVIEGRSDLLASSMGSYARIISAPCFVVPSISGDLRLMEDAGYRLEQLVVGLARLELGTCWVGALSNEGRVAQALGIRTGWRIPAVIVFGHPDLGFVGRNVNRLYRGVVGAPARLAFDKFVFAERFGQPATLGAQVTPVLEALRSSPSAGNSRPWRVILRGDELFYCVDSGAGFYRLYRNDYPLLDGGIGMASVTLALRARGRPAFWNLIDESPALRAELGLPPAVRLLASIRVCWPD
jgi:nitroreductase